MNMSTRDKAVQEWTSVHVTIYSNPKYFFAFSFRLSKEQWALNLLLGFPIKMMKYRQISVTIILYADSVCWFSTEKWSRKNSQESRWNMAFAKIYYRICSTEIPPPPLLSLLVFFLSGCDIQYYFIAIGSGGEGSQSKERSSLGIYKYIYPSYNCVSPTPCN